jgi:hypothetical protein
MVKDLSTKTIGLIALLLALTACAENSGQEDDSAGPGADTEKASEDTSGDATDTEDPSTDGPACLASISGQVLRGGEDGMEAVIVPCIGLTCFSPVLTDPDGRLLWEHPLSDGEVCRQRDFEAEPLHLEVTALENPEDFASYAFVRHPTREDISDSGEDDFDLNVGILSLYTLPPGGATFDPAAGASVDLDGLAFELPAGGIVKRVVEDDIPIDHEQAVRVFKAPLDTWNPPFGDSPLDALYFIAPRWAKLAGEGVALSLEPPPGWADGDVGTVLLLGGYTSNYGDDAVRDRSAFIYRGDDGRCINSDDHDALEQVDDGVFTACGTATMTSGRLVTSPIPRFTWIGISK